MYKETNLIELKEKESQLSFFETREILYKIEAIREYLESIENTLPLVYNYGEELIFTYVDYAFDIKRIILASNNDEDDTSFPF